MENIKLGSVTPDDIYLGNIKANKVYIGSALVWDKTSPSLPQTLFIVTAPTEPTMYYINGTVDIVDNGDGTWNISSEDSTDLRFDGTESTEIDIQSIDSLTTMRQFINANDNLTVLTVKAGLNTSNVGDFYSCFTALKNIVNPPDVSGWDVNAAGDLRFAFNNMNSITVPPDVSNWDVGNSTKFDAILSGLHNCLTPPDVSNWNMSKATSIRDALSLMYVSSTFPDVSLWDVGNITECSRVFQKCYDITGVPDVSNWNVAKVTTTFVMFSSCYNMDAPDFSSWDTVSLQNIGSMLYQAGKDVNGGVLSGMGIENWDINALTEGANFMYWNEIPTAEYDQVLINWEGQPHNSNVTISFGDSKYTPGLGVGTPEQARNDLTADGWVVSDGGSTTLRRDGKTIINRTTFGTRDDVILYDDDSVDVNGVPYPDAIVTEYEGQKRVALNPAEPTQIQVNALPEFAQIRITRVSGWNDVLGWKAELINLEEGLVPNAMAIAVYNEPEGNGYLFTTGAFVKNEETGYWESICPPGHENGHETINFSLLYGSLKYSTFSLFDNFDEMEFSAGGDI